MSKKIALLLCVLLVCTSAAAWSQGGLGRQRGQRGFGWGGPACVSATLMVPQPEMLENFATRLSLTADQKTKLTTELSAARTKLEPLRVKSAETMATLRKALFSDQDVAAVQSAAEAASKAEAALAAAELDAWIKIRPIFTADQLKTLGQAMGRGRQFGPGGPGGPGGENPPPPPPPAGE